MEPSTSGTPHAAPPNPAVSAIIVLLTLIVVGVVLVRTYPPAAHLGMSIYGPVVQKVEMTWSLAVLPADLRAGTFIAGDTQYQARHLTLVPTSAVIAPEVQKVYAQPYNTATQKAHPRISPGKTHVVFEQLTDGSAASTTQGWQVSVASVQNQEQHSLGRGVDPFFIDETHVGRFTPKGLIVSDIGAASSTETVLVAQPFTDAGFTLSVSPNQSLIAYKNVEKNRVEVYSITPTATSLVTTYEGSYTSFALSDAALYIVNASTDGTTVTRYSFTPHSMPRTIAKLPAALGITAVAF